MADTNAEGTYRSGEPEEKRFQNAPAAWGHGHDDRACGTMPCPSPCSDCGGTGDRVSCSRTNDPTRVYYYCYHQPSFRRFRDPADVLIESIQAYQPPAGDVIDVTHLHPAPPCVDKHDCDEKTRVSCYPIPDTDMCLCVHRIRAPLTAGDEDSIRRIMAYTP